MPGFDEEAGFGPPPTKPTTHTIGENLDALSAHDLDERIALCQREIARLKTAKAAREQTRLAADSLFRR